MNDGKEASKHHACDPMWYLFTSSKYQGSVLSVHGNTDGQISVLLIEKSTRLMS